MHKYKIRFLDYLRTFYMGFPTQVDLNYVQLRALKTPRNSAQLRAIQHNSDWKPFSFTFYFPNQQIFRTMFKAVSRDST